MWFTYAEDTWWIASAASSVKVRNLTADPRVSLALANGRAPVVAEGRAGVHREPFPADIVATFAAKYAGWDITDHRTDGPRVLLEVPVTCWLLTGTAR